MKHPLHHFKRRFSAVLLLVAITLALNSCFLKQDRTTVVYGTITDENGQPVDSILVRIKGVKGFQYETLKEMYSDKQGTYELIAEVPKRFSSTNIVVPFGSFSNPKYQDNYKGVFVKKNDNPTNNCCTASIGEKTKYDFQLISK